VNSNSRDMMAVDESSAVTINRSWATSLSCFIAVLNATAQCTNCLVQRPVDVAGCVCSCICWAWHALLDRSCCLRASSAKRSRPQCSLYASPLNSMD